MSRVVVMALSTVVFAFSRGETVGGEPARVMQLSVDATQAPRKLLQARQVIPVKPGPMTLFYSRWIQGYHSPSGPINDLTGLRFRAGGKELAWRRDDVDLYAFHCVIPEGASELEVALDYLAPSSNQAGGALGIGPASITARLATIDWYTVLLYPKDRPVSEIPVRASITLPTGWKLGTALPIESSKGALTQFQTAPLAMLADSPVLCGAHLREVPLGPAGGPYHFLVLACDSAQGLELGDELKGHYERLVTEAGALFGARHYRSYRFLVAMSEHISHFAVEHHECTDVRVPERFLLDDSYRKLWTSWVLPHEFVHSWNGKYRRPEGLATPDYQQPMRTQLLWVYEGLTQYLGFVLSGRSGLYTPELSQENLALIAEWARNQRGRTWRSLEDTAVAAPFLYSARSEWSSRRRGVDFYDEGALLWLDADTLIREKSKGQKSLDDFCRAFFAGSDGRPEVKPYNFPDVVKTLNDVVPHDWKTFLERRVTAKEAEPPLDGLTRGGWKMVYRDKPGELLRTVDSDGKTINLTASLGLLIKEDGQVTDVIPGTAADKAGIGPGMRLLAVNGRRLSAERLRHAVAVTKDGGKLALLFENQDFFRTLNLAYTGGERYPHLERIADSPDRLSAIFQPRMKK